MTKGNSYPTDNTCLAKHRVKGIKSPDTFIFFHMSQAGWASMTEMLHFLRWVIPGLFFFFLHFLCNLQWVDKIMPMSGFELQISGVGSNRSTN